MENSNHRDAAPHSRDSSTSLEHELEAANRDAMHMRREMLRWKQLANASQQQLRDIEASLLWRATGIFRLIPNLRQHLRPLLIIVIAAIVTLPFWPVLAIIVLFKSGRSFIWSLLVRAPSVLDLLMLIKQRLLGDTLSSSGTPAQAAPRIYDRIARVLPVSNATNTEDIRWNALQLVSPLKRSALDKLHVTPRSLVSENESVEFQSLATTEASIMKLSLASDARAE